MEYILKEYRGDSTLIDFENMTDDEILEFLVSEIDEEEIKRNIKFLMFHAFKNGKRKTFDALFSFADDPGKYVRDMGYEMYVKKKEDYEKLKKYLDFSLMDYYPLERVHPDLASLILSEMGEKERGEALRRNAYLRSLREAERVR